MKGCELCDGVARMYCESDQASLCWECDAKVHGANFLVARHTRVLLCRNCQSPTPWKASGAQLSPTFSICERCYACEKSSSVVDAGDCAGETVEERMEEDDEDYYEDDVSDTYDEDDDEEDDEDEDEEAENQVVPWSPTSPPPASSSSGESSSTGRFGADLLKRMRENVDLDFQHNITSSSSRCDHPVAASPRSVSFCNRSTASASAFAYSSKHHRSFLLLETTSSSGASQITRNHMSERGDHSTVNLMSSSSPGPLI